MSAYTDRVAHYLEGLEAVSTGICGGCPECARDFGFTDLTAFEDAVSDGQVEGEPSFSSRPCEICGSRLGGNREPWHAILDGDLLHFDSACVDCVLYLANGDEPPEEQR